MGGGDHPVLTDEGAPAEVEAGAGLGTGGGESQPCLSHLSPLCLTCPSSAPPHLQGHLPGPGAGHGVLPIDNPGEAAQHRVDGGDPAT